MKAMQFTREELEAISRLNAQAEERRRLVEDEKKKAELRKKYERAERQRAYYEANRERIAAYQKAYREKNKEKVAAYQKAYRAAAKMSPEERAAAAAKHEARLPPSGPPGPSSRRSCGGPTIWQTGTESSPETESTGSGKRLRKPLRRPSPKPIFSLAAKAE